MGKKTKVVNHPERLAPAGQRQFDLAAHHLKRQFQAPIRKVTLDRGGIDQGISDLRGFGPSQSTQNVIDRLGNFRGTARAQSSLDRLGGFSGSGDAFRTLASLENFGRAEQGFVTDARNQVLNFDEGFESQSLPLLLQAARGDFLTEQAGNPFLRDQINIAQQSSIDSFNEQVLPNLLASFSGTGGVGSTLQAGFANQQARDLQRNLGDISSNISFNVFEAERQRQLAAQQAILGFEDQGLDRQLAARTTNLAATQTTAQQLLDARIAAGGQATALSQQQLDALSARAQGEVGLSGQAASSLAAAAGNRVQLDALRQQALQGALSGEVSASGLDLQAQQASAQLVNDRIAQLIAAQEAAKAAGKDVQKNFARGI
jgi:hypothetical protein